MSRFINFLSSEIFNSRPLTLNKGVQVFLDTAILSAALLGAYLLRFEFSLTADEWRIFFLQLGALIPCQLGILYLLGVYKQIWRYISIAETKTILQSLAAATIPLLAIRLSFGIFGLDSISISIIILNACLAAIGLLGLRFCRRIIYEQIQKESTFILLNKKPVLLIGAGRAGVNTLAEIKGRGDIELEVLGFLDDDPLKKGAVINGIKVLGKTVDLPVLAKELPLDHVIISMAQTSRQTIERIVSICESIPLKVRAIPNMQELLQGKVTVSRIRDIQIEDLLGRPAIELDKTPIEAFLKNKRIMVTGAGGSIGSEMVRQLVRCSPKTIILLERSEYALFKIERELTELNIEAEIKPIVADITDVERISSIFRRLKPQIVFHAAAHKHVPLMEYNVSEALKNNILGTQRIGNLAGRFQAEAFVLISTDKAVNPTSVMGATKRVAELAIQELNQKYETRFLAVRFGNVMGSTGSVTTIFREQIKRGGPVTVTHPEMQRYFMTISEAVRLVMQAGAMGEGGEIFILDMGEPIKILNLAEKAIRLSGLKPNADINIVFTGIRPGEKMFEDLQTDIEQLTKTKHPKIFIGKIAPYPSGQVQKALNKINELCLAEDDDKIRAYLNHFLPEARLAGTIAKSGETTQAAEKRTTQATTFPELSSASI